MTRPTLSLKQIHYRDTSDLTRRAYLDALDVDGVAILELNGLDRLIAGAGEIVGGKVELAQPFKRGESFDTKYGLIWGWDGDRDAPTLSPSLVWDITPRVHFHLTRGKIVPCSDNVPEVTS